MPDVTTLLCLRFALGIGWLPQLGVSWSLLGLAEELCQNKGCIAIEARWLSRLEQAGLRDRYAITAEAGSTRILFSNN